MLLSAFVVNGTNFQCERLIRKMVLMTSCLEEEGSAIWDLQNINSFIQKPCFPYSASKRKSLSSRFYSDPVSSIAKSKCTQKHHMCYVPLKLAFISNYPLKTFGEVPRARSFQKNPKKLHPHLFPKRMKSKVIYKTKIK